MDEMNVSECLALANNALEQFTIIANELQRKLPRQGFTLSSTTSRQQKCLYFLNTGNTHLREAIVEHDIPQIINTLCVLALGVGNLKSLTQTKDDTFQRITRLTDNFIYQIMRQHQLASPLMQLPDVILKNVGAFIQPEAARAILPRTTTLYDEMSPTHDYGTTYDYRSKHIVVKKSGQLNTITTQKNDATHLFYPLPNGTTIYSIGNEENYPGDIYIRFQSGEATALKRYNNVCVVGDRYFFLTSKQFQEFAVIEMHNDFWEKTRVIPYPEECRGCKVMHIKPLSMNMVATVFDNGHCYLLDLNQPKQAWHPFYNASNNTVALDIYGTHEKPLLLVHTQHETRIFDLNPLISRAVLISHQIPNPESITCYSILNEGVLATGHADGQTRIWAFNSEQPQPTLLQSLSVEGLFGYDNTYIPQQLCHMEDDNLAIRCYSAKHDNSIILIMDPHYNHFIGKITDSAIDQVEFMLAIPNGDLLVGNQQKLLTWSPSKRDQIIYESPSPIQDCYILPPNQIAVIDKDFDLNLLSFPQKAEAVKESRWDLTSSISRWRGLGG